MNKSRFSLLSVMLLTVSGVVSAQSLFDDIYYDASKDKKTEVRSSGSSPSYAASMPSADTYIVSGTRNISVDDYNRRGVFATDTLSADTTVTDFTYTRRIEQFYNPDIVIASGDKDLAQIYYTEPTNVNIYVNTPTSYWGYDYFYPSTAWAFGWGPYYGASWRWSSPWYWNSWYDPYWSWGWNWGPAWAWGPSWGWGPGWGSSWGPGWGPGYTRPVSNNWNPRHPGQIANTGNIRPGYNGFSGGAGSRPGIGTTPAVQPGSGTHSVTGTGNRPGVRRPDNQNLINNINNSYRPGTMSGSSGSRPGSGTGISSGGNSNSYRPGTGTSSGNNNYNYGRPANNTNGGRQPSYGSGSFGGGRGSSGGNFGGGSHSSGSAGGRGRH